MARAVERSCKFVLVACFVELAHACPRLAAQVDLAGQHSVYRVAFGDLIGKPSKLGRIGNLIHALYLGRLGLRGAIPCFAGKFQRNGNGRIISYRKASALGKVVVFRHRVGKRRSHRQNIRAVLLGGHLTSRSVVHRDRCAFGNIERDGLGLNGHQRVNGDRGIGTGNGNLALLAGVAKLGNGVGVRAIRHNVGTCEV